jgi:hypothetical protein
MRYKLLRPDFALFRQDSVPPCSDLLYPHVLLLGFLASFQAF